MIPDKKLKLDSGYWTVSAKMRQEKISQLDCFAIARNDNHNVLF